jgi:16S rRNA (guanine1207-N2)-methyltransferase
VSDHYYTENPNVESSPSKWKTTIRGKEMSFTSDAGVFSKGGLDFGTKLLLESLVIPAVQGEILDVGCGYGPIGITIAKEHEDRTVTMVDVNERALHWSKENAKANHVSNVIVRKSDLLSQVADKHYACIITNPPIRAGKQVVHQLFDDAFEQLLPSGELWIVIRKKQGAPSAMEKLRANFEEVEVMTKKKGFFIIRAKKS